MPNHNPEHLLFRWIVIWNIFWEIGAKVKNFMGDFYKTFALLIIYELYLDFALWATLHFSPLKYVTK